jgi:hypothetical protein
MDDRKASLSSHDPGARVGADAAPTAPRVRHSTDVDLPHGDLVMVFCGNQQQVNEGFTIALRVMGIDSDVLRGRIPPATNHPTRRDN